MKIGAEQGQIDNEKLRIDFEYTMDLSFKPTNELRDFIFKGFSIFVRQITPVTELDNDEIKPKMVENAVQF